MIEIANLNKSFILKHQTIPILKNINFVVAKGEICGIIGKSGAGKSTLIKCLNLLERPDSGAVIIDGIDLTAINPHELRQIRQQIGVIFQGVNLLNSKTVYDNVALPLILHKRHTPAEIKQLVHQSLELVELSGFATKYPASLSGGQKQRVGIARALVTNPKVLLSDEATSALDPQTTNSILELLLDINRKLGLTIVLITHEIEVIRKICDQVVVMDNGVIVEQGRASKIILHPKHELTRKLIIEEEADKYLEQVAGFYRFKKNTNNNLIFVSFLGEQTFLPVLSEVSRRAGINFSILHGELGRIKNAPFGQLLLEISGDALQLANCFTILNDFNLHYEVIY